jgi:signal transduction histidine kinase
MGRLYWKFFIFFFLAQLTAVTGVGVSVWVANKNLENENEKIEASSPAKSLVESAAITLKFGGVNGLKALMNHWSQRPMPQVYAVNESNVELQGRELPEDVIKSARDILERKIFEGNSVGKSALINRSTVQQITADDGHQYLLFVPVIKRHDVKRPPPPNQLNLLGYNAKPKDRHLFPLIPLLAGVLASFVFAALLAWYFSKPIKQLRQAFASAANGNLDVRVGNEMGSRNDELADLGKAFDVMATRIGALMQSQTRLLHQVSHELRSPLARLQIAVGLARQQPDKLESSLMRIERESERMDSLVGELLELSRLESGVMRLEKETVDLNELLMTVVEDAQFEGVAKSITVDYRQTSKTSESLTILAQQDLLHRAIDNVVRNALKYSPIESLIKITSAIQDGKVVIHVTDQGPGVEAGELDSIFQAFFRGSKTNSAEGHGVGLAIAKQIIEAHGGTIVATNQSIRGLNVEIKLPT